MSYLAFLFNSFLISQTREFEPSAAAEGKEALYGREQYPNTIRSI